MTNSIKVVSKLTAQWGEVRPGDVEKVAAYKARLSVNPNADVAACEFSALLRVRGAQLTAKLNAEAAA